MYCLSFSLGLTMAPPRRLHKPQSTRGVVRVRKLLDILEWALFLVKSMYSSERRALLEFPAGGANLQHRMCRPFADVDHSCPHIIVSAGRRDR